MTVDFVDAALALGAATSPPPWLGDLRARGADAWRGQTLPTRKTETWRYTSLRKLERGDYLQQPDSACANAASSSIYAIPGLDACTIVFTRGYRQPRFPRASNSSVLPRRMQPNQPPSGSTSVPSVAAVITCLRH